MKSGLSNLHLNVSVLLRIARAGAWILVAMGAVGIFGWWQGNLQLITDWWQQDTIKLTTCFCLVFWGLALIFQARGQRAAALLLAGLVAVVSADRILDIGGYSVPGVKELFLMFPADSASGDFLHFAPNTAVSLILCAVALILTSFEKRSLFVVALFMEVTALTIGWAALLGRLFSMELVYTWSPALRMSLHSAIGIVLGSLAQAALTTAVALRRRGLPTYPLFALPALVVGITGVIFWAGMAYLEVAGARAVVREVGTSLEHQAARTMDRLLNGLVRVAAQDTHGKPEESWPDRLVPYFDEFASMLGVYALAPDGAILYRLRTVDPALDDRVREIAGAELARQAAPGDPGYRLVESGAIGEKRFAIFLSRPVDASSLRMVAIFDEERLFHEALGSAVFSGQFSLQGPLAPRKSVPLPYHIYLDTELRVGDLVWRLRIAPTPEYVSAFRTYLPITVCLAAWILGGLLSSLLYLWTAARRHATDLARSEARLAAMNESSALGILFFDAGGRLRYVNRRWREICGLANAGLDEIEKSISERRIPLEIGRWTSGGIRTVHREVLPCARLDTGAPMWVALYVSPVIMGEAAAGFVCLMEDITEKKEAELKSERLQATLSSVLAAATHVSIVAADNAGLIEVFNPGAENLLGYTAAEVIGRATPLIFHPKEVIAQRSDELSRMLNRKVEGLEVFAIGAELGLWKDTEWTCLKKDGTEIPVILTVTQRLDSKGCLCGYLGVAMDISEWKKVQEELHRAKEKAEAAAIAKSKFLANVSHEIRTPLTSIMGYVESLMVENPPEQEKARQLAIIYRNSEHLLHIINGILDIAKVESGKMDVEKIEFSLPGLLKDIDEIMSIKASEKGLRFSLEFKYPLPENVASDPTKLRQILVNLIGNAIKFTMQGDVKCSVAYNTASRRLYFDVSDTGVGLSAEEVAEIFEPFSQADPSTTRRFGGTGLGLAISRQLAGLLGGEITVRSVPGRGSTFSLVLPVLPPAGARMVLAEGNFGAADRGVVKSTVPQLMGAVLLAEDGRDNRELIRFLVKRTGIELVMVEDGAKVLEATQAREFDLILMDMQMPIMDGYTATRLLRERGYTRPILALTANTMREQAEHCIACGCDAFLGKPFSRQDFFDAIARYLSPAMKRSDEAADDRRRREPGRA